MFGVAIASLFSLVSVAVGETYSMEVPCEAKGLHPAERANRLLVVCKDKSAWLIETPSGRVVSSFGLADDTGAGERKDFAISPDGTRVAIGYWGGTVSVWASDLSARPVGVKRKFYENTLRFTPDGRALFVDNQRFFVGNQLRDGGAVPSDFDTINDIAYADGESVLAIANADTTVRLLDAESLNIKQTNRELLVEPLSLAFAGKNGPLVVGTGDGRVLALDPRTLRLQHSVPGLVGHVVAGLTPITTSRMLVEFSPAAGGASAFNLLDLSSWTLHPAPGFKKARAFVVRHGALWAYSAEGNVISAWN